MELKEVPREGLNFLGDYMIPKMEQLTPDVRDAVKRIAARAEIDESMVLNVVAAHLNGEAERVLASLKGARDVPHGGNVLPFKNRPL